MDGMNLVEIHSNAPAWAACAEASGAWRWTPRASRARYLRWDWHNIDSDIVMFGHGSNLPEPPLADDHTGAAVRDVIEEAPQPAPRSEEEAKFDGSKPPSSQVMPSDVKGVYAAALRAQQEEGTVAAHAVKPDPSRRLPRPISSTVLQWSCERDHRGLLVVAPIDHRPGRWRS